MLIPGLCGIDLRNTDECDLVATTGIMKKCVSIDLALNFTPCLSIRSDCEFIDQRASTCEEKMQGKVGVGIKITLSAPPPSLNSK